MRASAAAWSSGSEKVRSRGFNQVALAECGGHLGRVEAFTGAFVMFCGLKRFILRKFRRVLISRCLMAALEAVNALRPCDAAAWTSAVSSGRRAEAHA